MPDGDVAVDTGFIVYNEPCYPNLTALFAHLKVPTAPSNMSFAVSMGGGAYEYAGSTVLQMVGHARNLFSLGHMRMMRDLLRFLRSAAGRLDQIPDSLTLGDFIRQEGYSQDFADRHLLPMAGAIWSSALARAWPTIPPGPSSVSSTITGCSRSTIARPGAPSGAARRPMSRASSPTDASPW